MKNVFAFGILVISAAAAQAAPLCLELTEPALLSSQVSERENGLRFAAVYGPGRQALREKRDQSTGKQLVILGSHERFTHVAIVGAATRKYIDANGQTVYLAFDQQPVELRQLYVRDGEIYNSATLDGQGPSQHPTGFSTVIGNPVGFEKPLENYKPKQLPKNMREGRDIELNYPSGVIVRGKIKKIQTDFEGYVAVIKFEAGTATVTFGEHVLFKPEWGEYDMLVGSSVTDAKSYR